MRSVELKVKNEKSSLDKKRMSFKEKFGQADYVLEQISQYIKDGDVASITDLISSYISNCPKYKNQQSFAEAIGTTRQTLHRMLSHSDSVSIRVFFRAIEQIHADATEA